MAFGGKYERLLQPLQVKNLRFRNRMVKPATTLGFAGADGSASPMLIDFYENLARGGVGLLITESSCVDFPVGGKGENRLRIDDDQFLPSFQRLTDAIHRHGCPSIIQLTHNGPAGTFSGLQPLVPSVLSKEDDPVADPRMAYDPPRAMTKADIDHTIAKHAEAALRAKKAGFDGVEFHAGHCYLLNAFLSRVWNQRDDDYGCQSVENRARIVVEIVKAARQLTGPDFVLCARINGQEWGHAKGTTVEEAVEIAQRLEAAGLDMVNVTNWGYGNGPYSWAQYAEQMSYPERVVPEEVVKKPGILASKAAVIKKHVSIPVIAVGSIGPDLGEWILKEGMADAVAMGRRLLADPELPRKITEGRYEDVRPCMQGLECRSEFKRYVPNHCRVNASLGKEGPYAIRPAEKKKHVIVVGGGPAGMEAARVARLRGHDVTLYEKNSKLGGSVPVQALIKGTEIEKLPALVKYFETQVRKAGVHLRLGREFTVEKARSLQPDAVVVAVGGARVTPDIPGIDMPHVLRGEDLMSEVMPWINLVGPEMLSVLTHAYLPMGRRIAILGGQLHGCQLAAFLVKRGRQVTVIEQSDRLGDGISIVMRDRLIDWLKSKGTVFLTETACTEVRGNSVVLKSKDGAASEVGMDNVIVVLPTEPNLGLAKALTPIVPEVHAIGDCLEGKLMLGAIASGARVGHAL